MRGCDRIFVLAHGAVVETGAYDELLDFSVGLRAMAARGGC